MYVRFLNTQYNHVILQLVAETVEIDHTMEDHQELLKRTDLISEEVPAATSDTDNAVKSRVVRMHIVP